MKREQWDLGQDCPACQHQQFQQQQAALAQVQWHHAQQLAAAASYDPRFNA